MGDTGPWYYLKTMELDKWDLGCGLRWLHLTPIPTVFLTPIGTPKQRILLFGLRCTILKSNVCNFVIMSEVLDRV